VPEPGPGQVLLKIVWRKVFEVEFLSRDGTIGEGTVLFEADLVEGVFHRLPGDPDDSPERRVQLLRHFDCARDCERAEEQRKDCSGVTRREQKPKLKKRRVSQNTVLATEPRSQSCSARPKAIASRRSR
jgi:hypothetical protein